MCPVNCEVKNFYLSLHGTLIKSIFSHVQSAQIKCKVSWQGEYGMK